METLTTMIDRLRKDYSSSSETELGEMLLALRNISLEKYKKNNGMDLNLLKEWTDNIFNFWLDNEPKIIER